MSLIGGIASGLGSLAGAIAQGVSGAKAYEISKQNLQFQKEAFAYQQRLNEEYMKRQDNKLQYMVADAKKAGINPLASLGSAGGYSPLQSGQAPQQDTSFTNHFSQMGNTIAKGVTDAINVNNQSKLIASQVGLNLQDTNVKKQIESVTKHDLEWAQKRDIPVSGNIPDWQRDMWTTFKPYLVDLLEHSNKDIPKLIGKVDSALNYITHSTPIHTLFSKDKGVIKFTEKASKDIQKALIKEGVVLPDNLLGQIMMFIVDQKIKVDDTVNKIKGVK